jgi:hypothetical protein
LTHAPLVNSPAVDQGKRDIIPTLSSDFDQRSEPRPVDDSVVTNGAGGDSSDIGAVELAVGVHPTSAKSRKIHGGAGAFDVDLPLVNFAASPLGIECRSPGGTNACQIILTFAAPVAFTSAGVTSGAGSVASASGSGTSQVTIDLIDVTDLQKLTVALFGTNDGTNSGDLGLRLGILVGDTNSNGTVSASDIGQTKGQSGASTNAGNFRTDANVNGTVNGTDIALVKAGAGHTLP